MTKRLENGHGTHGRGDVDHVAGGTVRSGGLPLRVALVGFGTVNRAVLDLIRERRDLRLVAVGTRNPQAASTWIEEHHPDLLSRLTIGDDPGAAITQSGADVAIIATRSAATDVIPLITAATRAGASALCTSEELSYLKPTRPELHRELCELAMQTGRVIVATGVNPGFLFDCLPLTLTEVASAVTSVRVQRSIDASPFGAAVRRSLGIGYTPDAFRRALAGGAIRGHIGFRESADLILTGIGDATRTFEEVVEPVMAERDHGAGADMVPAGLSAGVRQRAVAQGEIASVRFELSLHVAAAELGWQIEDRIDIEGAHPLSMAITPGCHPIKGTSARIVNTLPLVPRIEPGFYPARDLLRTPPQVAGAAYTAAQPAGAS